MVNLRLNHSNLTNELDEFCTRLKTKRNNLEFGLIEINGTSWYRNGNEIKDHKAMNFLLAKSRKLVLSNSSLDMRNSPEILEANSALDELTLRNSEFYAPLLWDG